MRRSKLRTDMWYGLPGRRHADLHAGAGRTVYFANFSREPPWRGGRKMGAHHGAEIPYVFGVASGAVPLHRAVPMTLSIGISARR